MQHQAISKSTFSEVIELINLGQLVEAEGICRDAIKNNPDDVNMLGLLGVLSERKISELQLIRMDDVYSV